VAGSEADLAHDHEAGHDHAGANHEADPDLGHDDDPGPDPAADEADPARTMTGSEAEVATDDPRVDHAAETDDHEAAPDHDNQQKIKNPNLTPFLDNIQKPSFFSYTALY
jgi:hypothetical protein